MKRLIVTMIILISISGYNVSYGESLSPLKKGVELYQQGKYELSLVFLEKAFGENPLNEQLYFYLANVYNHKKMYKKSIEAYERGLEIADEKNKTAFQLNLARSYQADRQFKEALDIYDTIEKKTDQYPEVYLYKGMVYFHLENKTQVINSWESYLAKAPSNPQYSSIQKAITKLKDKNFKWSNKKKEVSKGARDEEKKLVKDEDKGKDRKLSDEEIKKEEEKLVKKLKEKEQAEANKNVDESVSNVKVDSENLQVADQAKKEGAEFDEIER